jgi:hypothetical protein
MAADSKKPSPQPETEFMGELREFKVQALPPDDPRLEPRIRKGRPADRKSDPRFDLPDEAQKP